MGVKFGLHFGFETFCFQKDTETKVDSQLVFLNIAGLADIVITEDSNLTLFCCDKILFKMQDTVSAWLDSALP